MVKQKVLELANHIGNKKMGSKSAYTENDPEYLILEPIVTDEMADVALCMEMRKKVTAEQLAPKCGKSVEETKRLLDQLAEVGVYLKNRRFWGAC